MRFSEFGNSKIKEHTDYTTEPSAINIFDSKLKEKMAEQGNLWLNLLNQINDSIERIAQRDSGLSFPFDYDQSFE